MTKTWFVSDTHFGHEATWKHFKRNDGSPMRDFSSTEEMDDFMVERWNSVVQPNDRVYHLGDLAMSRRHIATVGRCNGRKVLIKGNHDIFKLKDYMPYFDDIRSYKVFPNHGIICSHIPLHPAQFERRWKANVHGHLHVNHVLDVQYGPPGPLITAARDPRYINVSVEQINYTPITFDELLERVAKINADQTP